MCIALAVLLWTLAAGDLMEGAGTWPQFRGPDGQGRSSARNLPLRWSENENLSWKTPIPGRGWSSPVVDQGEVWLTTATDGGKSLRAVAVNFADGRIRKNVALLHLEDPPTINPKNSYASPTPVVEEGMLYAHFGTFGTVCLDTKTSSIVWTNQDLRLDHKEGPGGSPILYGNLMIFHCDGMDVQYVAALNKRTGKLAWKTSRPSELPENPDYRKAYCTPLVVRAAGRDQLISPGADWVVAYDPATGEEIWRVRYQGFSNVPRPIAGDGRVFICTGYMKPQLWAIEPTGQGDITKSHVRWRLTQQVPANPSPLLVEDRIYLVSDQGIASCVDAGTGKVHWKERLGGNYSASPIYAAGRIYLCSEEGKTSVIEPGDTFKRLAENQLDGQIMATPAIVEPAILLRTDTHLYRIQDKAG